MTVRPGRGLIVLALLWTLCAVVVVFWPALAGLLWIGALGLLVLVIFEYREVRSLLKQFGVTARVPDVVPRDQPFVVTIDLTRPPGRTVRGHWRQIVPTITGVADRTYSFTIEEFIGEMSIETTYRLSERGLHRFGDVWLRVESRWRLIDLQTKFPNDCSVQVLPENLLASESLLKTAGAQVRQLDQAARTRDHGAGTEFESLTEFRENDDPRRIDWRVSARQRRLIARRFQVERHRDVMIIVDCGRLMAAEHRRLSKLDAAIDAGLLLAHAALRGGDRCGFVLYDQAVLGYLPPQSGPLAMRRIKEHIYDVQSQWRESDFTEVYAVLNRRQQKRSLVVVLSDVIDLQTTDRFRASLSSLSRQHVVLFAALRTPLLYEQLVCTPQVLENAWEPVLSGRLLQQREEALLSLKRNGIHVLDALPESLGPSLVNEFLTIRSRNLL